MIAALFVETNGVYFGLPDVDPWDIRRDARLYDGPHPVVAHPPCQRWGRYWSGGPMLARGPNAKKKGDDDGCFASAIASVRRFGGVLEHPEASHAWRAFGVIAPPKSGEWVTGDRIGWTCCVEQGHYGHQARKATWLYYVGEWPPPPLVWGPSAGRKIDAGFHSKAERAAATEAQRKVPRISENERTATPLAFRDALINIVRGARARGAT